MEKTTKTPEKQENINELAQSYKKHLVSRLSTVKTSSILTWAILNIIMVIAQIGVLIAAAIALSLVIQAAEDENDYVKYLVQFIAIAIVILTFVLTIVTSVFTALAKTSIYKSATEKIQLETLNYSQKIGEYRNVNPEKHLEERVNKIIEEAYSVRKSVSMKLILLNVLTRGAYEK